jgi:hypothetical protein
VLLRLAKARHASALEAIERAWRQVAPRRLVASLRSPRGEATRRARP